MIDASPEMLESTRPWVPHFRFILDDLAALSLDALGSRGLSEVPLLVQLALWASRSFPRLRSAAPLMRAVMGTLVFDDRMRRFRFGFLHYLWDTAPRDVDAEVIRTILLEIAGPEGREDVMNAGEQLRAEGREQGRAEGLEALRAAVNTVMSARQLPLSEAGLARLASCRDVATLTRWHARAVTATTEGEVFADDPG
jgi:hypothetical protein